MCSVTEPFKIYNLEGTCPVEYKHAFRSVGLTYTVISQNFGQLYRSQLMRGKHHSVLTSYGPLMIQLERALGVGQKCHDITMPQYTTHFITSKLTQTKAP